MKLERKPNLSVVVVVYNMSREAPRTLHSLSAAYQRHIDPDEYEVIVVDNCSNPPLDPNLIDRPSGNFRLIRIDDASPSPAQISKALCHNSVYLTEERRGCWAVGNIISLGTCRMTSKGL